MFLRLVALEIKPGWCDNCGERVGLQRRAVNLALHLSLAVLTLGLWLPVMGLNYLVREPWRCRFCGSKHVYRNELQAEPATDD